MPTDPVTAPTPREQAAEVLAAHTIECTGLGEVTCRCREHGWMSWGDYRAHVIDMLAAAGLLPDREEWGVQFPGGVQVQDEAKARVMVARYQDVPNGGAPALVHRYVTEWRTA
jgi:hypothetical protein